MVRCLDKPARKSHTKEKLFDKLNQKTNYGSLAEKSLLNFTYSNKSKNNKKNIYTIYLFNFLPRRQILHI